MKVMQTAKEFYDFFKSIPEEKWTMKIFHNKQKTKFCAYGHLGVRYDETDHSGWSRVNKNVCNLDLILGSSDIVDINDGEFQYVKYGKTPKTRILHALKFAIQKGR